MSFPIDESSEQISLPLEQIGESIESHLLSNSGSFDGLPSVSELPESPPNPAVYTDVNVVPEHEKKEFEQMISDLEGEIVELRLKKRSLDEKRREALNKILDIKGSIRVFCRVRPYLSTVDRKIQGTISIGSEKIVVRSSGIRKEFSLDKVFPQEAMQEDVFIEVEPILRSALDGHNVCIFAYGQTGTGKTFTMEGTKEKLGIVPRAIEELFRLASQDNSVSYTFSMSILEVYMGNLRDLLAQKTVVRTTDSVFKCGLNIQTASNGLVEIENLMEVVVADSMQANRWYTKGRKVRSTSWTNVNEASSRSHCLTRISIGQSGVMEGKETLSKLWMVDLGGSERLLKTGAIGQTLDEGKAINLSLSALGDVIAALKRKRNHIPYRNSKLTQILRDSLGDSSKALMLVHISPSENDIGETICSLNFAQRARAIESTKELSEDSKKHREKRIAELDQQIRIAEEECEKIRNHIQKAEYLVQEKKKLFAMPYGLLEDEKEFPQCIQTDHGEIIGTPRTADKAIRKTGPNSQPRFMTSTVCSRQRQSLDGENNGRVRNSRSGNRSSVELFGSQSLSYSDSHFKSNIRSSTNRKSRLGELNTVLTENSNCKSLDLRLPSIIRNKVSTSNPNLRVTLGRHRRRFSDLS